MRAAIISLLLFSAPAAAYVRTTTHSQCPNPTAYPLYWGQTTVPYVIDAATTPDVSGGAVDAVRASFQTWDDIASSYINFRYDGTMANAPVGFDLHGTNENVVRWIESGWTAASSAIAITVLTFDCSNGQILDADITLNGQNHTFTINPAVDVSRDDVQNTVTHEVGHVLGFDHNPDPESTLYAGALPGETKKRDLTADDIQGACDVYAIGHEPPPDGGTNGSGGSGGGGDTGCASVPGGVVPDSFQIALVALVFACIRRKHPA
jgi:matrixin